jgi:3-hydroxyacyl-CoA dehydrogenase
MKVAIIGSGTMGSSIAAHIASCGHQVLLLDLLSEPSRNALAQKALERIKTSSNTRDWALLR